MKLAAIPFAALLILCVPCRTLADQDMETMIVNITLNGQGQGEFFVRATPDGDFLIKTDDLKAMHIEEPRGKITSIEDEPHLSLKSLEGAEFRFDVKTLALDLTVAPSHLPKQTLDFLPKRRSDVEFTRDSSAFFNYAATYTGSRAFSGHGLNIYNELGVRLGDFLFYSDSAYRDNRVGGRVWTRGMSQIVYDRRETLQRAIAGDSATFPGELGSAVTLGGLSFSKHYLIDPYFIRYPLPTIAGAVPLPSTVDIFLDGMKIGSNPLAPGEYDLRNISYYRGRHDLDLVLRDPFGREQRLNYPYYYSDFLLGKGLHEYSYNLGFLRRNIGTDLDAYGPLAASAFHRYGVTDFLTLGLRGEGSEGLYNMGGSASFTLGSLGTGTLSASGSRREGRYGFAGAAGYSYQGRHFNTALRFRTDSRNYATLDRELNESAASFFPRDRIRCEIGATVGYTDPQFGSLSVGYYDLKTYGGRDREAITASYSKTLFNRANLFATAGKIREPEAGNGSGYQFSMGLIYYFGDEINVSVRHDSRPQGDAQTLQIQKNIPAGEGYAYNMGLSRFHSSSGPENYAANPMFQYNGPYGIYRGQYDARLGGDGKVNDIFQLSAAGGIAYVGGMVGLSRPVTDSFGLVKVGEIEGVKVSVNNQFMGRTNASGKVFIPRMSSYYDNLVAMDDKDLPINYSLSGVQKYVSPPLRGGAVIHFEATKTQAVTGFLKTPRERGIQPLEFRELRIRLDGVEQTSFTGRGGEFYLENLKAGDYQGGVEYAGYSCRFRLAVPETDEMFIDLGEVVCEPNR
jgi:outer membrane usher protein